MSHQDGEALRQQFLSEHDDLSPEEQAHWADQAQQQNSANGYANGDGASSPVSSTGQYDFPVETTPRPVQPLAGSPASVGKAVRTVAQADAANGDLAPGYGSARIIHDAPRPQDTTTTDADGTRHIHRPDGGEVAMPAVQRQDGPNDDPAFAATNGRRTGIYVNGKEQVKRPDGSIVPGQGSSLALNTGAKPSDPFSKAATDDFPVSTTPKPDALTASLMNGGTPLAATAMASTVTPPPEPDTTPVPLSVDDSSSTAGPTVHVNGTSQPKLAAPAADSPAPDNEEEGAEQAFPGTTPRPFKRQRSATTL